MRSCGIVSAPRSRPGTVANFSAIVQNLSPAVVLVDHIRGRKSEGPASYVARFRPILEAHPDMRGETVSIVVEGNTIVHETVWRSRQTAPLETHQGTIPATNEQVALFLGTAMGVGEDGKPTLIRAYGTSVTPVVAHASGIG